MAIYDEIIEGLQEALDDAEGKIQLRRKLVTLEDHPEWVENGKIKYRDCVGSVEFSEVDQLFHGKLIDIDDLVTYEGENMGALILDFCEAVDDYIECCEKKKND